MINKLKDIINKRTVAIVLQGKSVEELERCIEDFKDKDICWASLGVFDIIEDSILSKIGKNLDIVFDCATVPEARLEYYETTVRFPRITKFLERGNNLWITTHGLIRDSVKPFRPDILEKYSSQILQVDSIFPLSEVPKYMDVPNSVTLLIAAMLCGGASKIVIFGLDGYKGDPKQGVNFYYKPSQIRKERFVALGTDEDPGISRDTDGFQVRFPKILSNYRNLFNNWCEIYNCSPNSHYQIPTNINYTELRRIL